MTKRRTMGDKVVRRKLNIEQDEPSTASVGGNPVICHERRKQEGLWISHSLAVIKWYCDTRHILRKLSYELPTTYKLQHICSVLRSANVEIVRRN